MSTAPAPNGRAASPSSPGGAEVNGRGGPPPTAAELADARAEHDVVAKRLEARRSIEFVRRGALQGFAALISFGFAARLAWDRWAFAHGWTTRPPPRPPTAALPLFFLAALGVFLALLVLATRSLRRARALMREEDVDFARLLSLRALLGLDR